MFKRNFLLFVLIQFLLIGLLIAEKSKFNKHKSSFDVENVINSVETFNGKLEKSLQVFSDTEKCAEELSLFAEALDERDDWAIGSENCESDLLSYQLLFSSFLQSVRLMGKNTIGF
jgi:hypothetical protein